MSTSNKSNLILTVEGANEAGAWAWPSDFEELRPQMKQPVVLVNGGFDILHPGHLRLIQQARLRAGTLVCALDSDEKIREAKGPGRPIMSWIERATCLGYIGVDYIVEINTEEDMRKTVQALKPDFRIQGAEYMEKPTRFPDVKRLFVRCWGTSTRKCGTSDIIERCKRAI